MAVDRGTRRAISRTMSTSTTQDARAVRSARRNPSSKNAHKTCSSERSSGGEAENEMVCTLPNVLRVGRCDAVPPDCRRRQRACATAGDRRKESGPGGEEDARKQARELRHQATLSSMRSARGVGEIEREALSFVLVPISCLSFVRKGNSYIISLPFSGFCITRYSSPPRSHHDAEDAAAGVCCGCASRQSTRFVTVSTFDRRGQRHHRRIEKY